MSAAKDAPVPELPADADWHRMVRAGHRIRAVLERLEPERQRRVLAAVCVLLGHDELAAELLRRPEP